jgi:hypothetical protein
MAILLATGRYLLPFDPREQSPPQVGQMPNAERCQARFERLPSMHIVAAKGWLRPIGGLGKRAARGHRRRPKR